jgi:hypothetical protein
MKVPGEGKEQKRYGKRKTEEGGREINSRELEIMKVER